MIRAFGRSAAQGALAAVGSGMVVAPLVESTSSFGRQVVALALCGLTLSPLTLLAPSVQPYHGTIQGAFEVMSALYEVGHRDEETVRLLASIHRDLAREAEGEEARAHPERAYALYAAAYEAHPDSYWVGDQRRDRRDGLPPAPRSATSWRALAAQAPAGRDRARAGGARAGPAGGVREDALARRARHGVGPRRAAWRAAVCPDDTSKPV